MNSPAMTWKVRRIGQTLWASVRTRDRTRWSWIERVWRKDYVEPRAVDVQIRRLRCMLADEGYPGYIQTIRGVGYRFAEPG